MMDTLSTIIMEMQNYISKETSIGGTSFPLPCLSEEEKPLESLSFCDSYSSYHRPVVM